MPETPTLTCEVSWAANEYEKVLETILAVKQSSESFSEEEERVVQSCIQAPKDGIQHGSLSYLSVVVPAEIL